MNASYDLTLTVSDGINTGVKNIEVIVNNRIPYQIFTENLSTSTYNSIVMPDVFKDDDGSIVAYSWFFPDGVNLGGGVTDRSDDFTQTTSSQPNPMPSWDTPGFKTAELTVTDDDGSSVSTTLSIRVLNQNPVADFVVKTTSSGTSLIDFRVEDGQVETPYTFDGRDSFDPDGTEADDTFAAPHALLYFDSDGTRDGDQSFEGKYVPLDSNSPDWNGIVQYTWDFGDGSPLNSEPTPWHSYSLPGEYIVSLTVRDAFGTGDVSRSLFTVVVDHPPIIHDIFIQDEIIVSDSYSVSANISDLESDLGIAVYRDTNVNDGSISDRDETLSPDLIIRWDIDIEVDANENGNPADDWIDPIAGSESRISGSWDDLDLIRLILEDEAKQAAEAYTDVEHVESQGGLLGMDHHTPPPAPGILSKDERRSDDSGYVRPLRRRS